MIYIKETRRFIKYNNVSAYRWGLNCDKWELNTGDVYVEMLLTYPRFVSQEEGLKEIL